MTRREWLDVALALSDARRRLLARRHVKRAEGVHIAALTVCKAIRAHSSRFDGRRFMRIVRSGS